MKLSFHKRAGKYDELRIERADGTSEAIQCPKQGMIPHDMVHYAVEKCVLHQGFLTRVADGEAAGFAMDADDAAEAVERLVETMQAETWSGRIPAAELIAVYEHACGARGHAVLPVSEATIAAIRAEMDALDAQWAAVPVNGALTLSFERAASEAQA